MSVIRKFCATLGLLGICGVANADLRPFAFVDDAYPEGKGEIEYEQYVTWKGHKSSDHDFSRFELKHEFEFGISDHLDLAAAIEWSHQDSEDGSATRFDGANLESKIYFTNPLTDFVGTGLFIEGSVGDNSVSLEAKFVLQKDIGQWTLAYNLAAETAVEGVFRSDENETEGELANLFGVSYAVNKNLRVGGEMVIESVWSEWRHYEDTAVYLGPNVALNVGEFNFIFTPLFQLGDAEGEPDFYFRLLATFEF